MSKNARIALFAAAGCLAVVVLGIGLVTCVAVLSKDSGSPTASGTKKEAHSEGETFRIGYTTYTVHGSRWAMRLVSDGIRHEPPNASYLVVDVTVTNEDSVARMVPPFTLVDDQGAQCEPDASASVLAGSIILENLNPGVSRRGRVVFDVRPERTYRLYLRGGFWSSDWGLVDLSPIPW